MFLSFEKRLRKNASLYLATSGCAESKQATQHHPGCASFRPRAQPQSSTATVPVSHLNTCPMSAANGGTCHQRSKTPVPPNAIAAISSDDSCRLEAVQVPTSEAYHQRQYLAATEGSAKFRSMTSQAALNLVDSTATTTTAQRPLQQVPQSRTFPRDDCIIEDYDADFEHQGHMKPSSTVHLPPQNGNMSVQPRRASCLSGSQPSLSTLAAFVTGASSLHHHHHHQQQQQQQPSGHQHRSCHSPSQQMLLCAANSKTPPHQVAQTPQQQRCLANEPSEASSLSAASAPASHKPHSNFGHSSTLPPNSTLGSLLASAKGNSDQRNMQPHELRRQTSMSHLDKVAETKCKASLLTKGEAKLGSFQQRLKAMLSTSPKLDSPKVNGKSAKFSAAATTSTYRSGEDIDGTVNDSDVLGVRASALKDQTTCSGRPLSTLNKYTLSVSSTNLSPHSAQSVPNFAGLDSYDEEDSYHLRNVCNKLFSQKQYSCLHSSSSQLLPDNVMSSVQKSSISDQNCYRNITPEMNVEKVSTKENIYSAYNRSAHSAVTANTTASPQLTSSSAAPLNSVSESVEFMQSYSTMNDDNGGGHDGHVVVVSELSPKAPTSSSGLTVRSQTPHERLSSPKIQADEVQNGGSSLSLNVAMEASESVASQDHSSESGRGTMNSHLEERSQHHIDLNSPADLTSLDSDQSGHQEATWKEATNGTCIRRPDTVNLSNYSTIQRYLDDQQRSSAQKEADLAICKDFKSKLSLNDESDSWTSLSDEPSTKKTGSSKSKSKAPPATHKSHHQQQSDQPKLKTNFSKPENCLSPNSKMQAALLATKPPQSPAMKPKMTLSVQKIMTENDGKPPNGMQMYDKSCIYSVPNKGKYRSSNLAQYGNVPCESKVVRDAPYAVKECDNGSLSSDPESNFPDDGCSEFTDYFHNEHHDPLRKQLRGIEDMYSELLSMLNNKSSDHRPRRKLYRRNSGRSSVASRNTRDYISRRYRGDHRRSKPDDLQLSRRYKKLESQVLTLAKSVSQLSADIQFNFMLNEEMESLRHEVEMLKSQMSNVKQNVCSLNKSQQHQQAAAASQQQQQQQVCTTLNRSKEPKKVDKLKRLFVDEPQPMKQFLKKLGYEKYLKHFEAEKIGLAELVHLNEERLHKLGIPMGPRIRIIQEAKSLVSMANGKTSAQTGRAVTTLPDNCNIYAVV